MPESDSDVGMVPTAANTYGHDPSSLDDEVLWDMRKSHVNEEEEIVYQEIGNNTDVEDGSDCEEFWEDEDLHKMLINMAIKEGDDPKDEDWLPLK